MQATDVPDQDTDCGIADEIAGLAIRFPERLCAYSASSARLRSSAGDSPGL